MRMIGYVIYRLLRFYELLIVIECILSWFPVDGIVGDIFEAIRSITEPYVGIFRRLIPSVGGGGMRIDFSPMIAIIVLDIIGRVVLSLG